MSVCPIFNKLLLINNIMQLCPDVLNVIKEYVFHEIKKIPKNDKRYDLLLTIPMKEYDPTDETTCVYIGITDDKDYYIVYTNFKLQLQTLKYGNDDDDDANNVYFIDGSIFVIE